LAEGQEAEGRGAFLHPTLGACFPETEEAGGQLLGGTDASLPLPMLSGIIGKEAREEMAEIC